MSEDAGALEQSLCDMYRDGSSFRTLEVAFEKTTEEIIRILHQQGVIQQNEGESWEDFVTRVKDDVGHNIAG